MISGNLPERPAVAALALVLAACAPAATTPSASPPLPAADSAAMTAEATAASLRRGTLPASPRQIGFAWSLDEAGASFRGRGVGRFIAPSRFRLDLFGPRGETYLAAALVDGEVRIPPAVEERFKLPSPALLWAAVGAFDPPAGARLLGSRGDGGTVTLRYDAGDDGILEFRSRDSSLVSVRRLRGGGVQESVDLERTAAGELRQARYRDWPAFRTLTLTLESSTDVTGFPDDIWAPPGAGR